MKIKMRMIAFYLLFILNIGQQLSAQENNKQIIIKAGVYDNPPKVFIDEDGKPAGIFIDILQSIAKNENLQVEYVIGEWQQLMALLYKGEIDVMPDVAYSKERYSQYSFCTLPVLSSWLDAFTLEGVQINSPRDLNKRKIGVLKGSIQDEYITGTLRNDFHLSYVVKTYNDYEGQVKALKKKDIDVIIGDRFFYFSKLCDKEIFPTGFILRPTELYFAFSKGKNSKLIKQFDKNISILRNDPKSDYYKSLQKWFDKYYYTGIPKYMKWLFVIIGIILFIVSAFAFLLHNRVQVKTAKLRLKNEELLAAKENLEEGEKKLQLIADNIPNGMIYQVFIDDNDKKHITYISKSVEKFYGCSVADAKNDSDFIYSKIHPDDIQNLKTLEAEAIKNMSVFQAEARILQPDGSNRWFYFISSPRYQKNRVIWDGIQIDINNQKESEQALISAKEKAEESDRLKSIFLQNMSHEIRTPMNGILGFTSLLKSKSLDTETKNKYIDIINKSGQRLLNTINDIMEISKIESKQIAICNSEVNIVEIMNYHYHFFRPLADEKGIILKLSDHVQDEKAIIETDNHILNSILTNLINNAIKFTHHGSVEFGNYIDGSSIVFFVRDTGIGIPEDRLIAIFERFVQADLNITRSHEGAGLGLSIVKAYTEILGGKTWVTSEINKGSDFFFSIPYKQVKSSNPGSKVETYSTLKKRLTVLIAEDDEFSFLYIESILKNPTISLLWATNGEETIRLFQENPDVSLILMDIKMPGMSGFEATRKIRQISKTIPIIAQTAYIFAGDKQKALDAGCNDYIAKPIKKDDLIKMIKKYTA